MFQFHVRAAVVCTALMAVPAAPSTFSTVRQALPVPGWVQVAPGGATSCALDTPYSFFYRPQADTGLLLLYFQGGGACWDWVSCSGLFDSSVTPDEVAPFRGIFDTGNPANPLRGASTVFIPYCTGDVHVGDTSRRYGDTGAVIAHRGYRNVRAVFTWLTAQALHPRTVVVAGTSAGSYAALFYARTIADLFPDSRVVVLGDSGVPLLSHNREVLAGWGADSVLARLWGRPPGPTPLLDAYRQAAAAGDRIQLAELASNHDAVQSAFYLVSGSPDWRPATYRLLAAARNAVPALRTFLVAGSDHGLLPTDRFYSYEEEGQPLSAWIQRLIDGAPVTDVRCAACVP